MLAHRHRRPRDAGTETGRAAQLPQAYAHVAKRGRPFIIEQGCMQVWPYHYLSCSIPSPSLASGVPASGSEMLLMAKSSLHHDALEMRGSCDMRGEDMGILGQRSALKGVPGWRPGKVSRVSPRRDQEELLGEPRTWAAVYLQGSSPVKCLSCFACCSEAVLPWGMPGHTCWAVPL